MRFSKRNNPQKKKKKQKVVHGIGPPVPQDSHEAVAALAAASPHMVAQPASGGTGELSNAASSMLLVNASVASMAQGISPPLLQDGHEAVATLAAASPDMVAQSAPGGTDVAATGELSNAASSMLHDDASVASMVHGIGPPVPQDGDEAVAALAASPDMFAQPASVASTQDIGPPLLQDDHESVATLAAYSPDMVAQSAPGGTDVAATGQLSNAASTMLLMKASVASTNDRIDKPAQHALIGLAAATAATAPDSVGPAAPDATDVAAVPIVLSSPTIPVGWLRRSPQGNTSIHSDEALDESRWPPATSPSGLAGRTDGEKKGCNQTSVQSSMLPNQPVAALPISRKRGIDHAGPYVAMDAAAESTATSSPGSQQRNTFIRCGKALVEKESPPAQSPRGSVDREEEDEGSGHPAESALPISRKPGGLYDSYIAVSQRNKRRRSKHGCFKVSAVSRARRLSRSSYVNNQEAVLERKKLRYASSPGFASRLVNNVKQKYKLSPRYRQTRLRQSAKRFEQDVSFRTKVCSAATVSQPKRRSTSLGREQDKASDKKRYRNCLTRRQAVITTTAKSIKEKYHTQSPYKRRLQARALVNSRRMRSLISQTGCQVKKPATVQSNDKTQRVPKRGFNVKDKAEGVYVQELRVLMRKQSHLQSLLQRKITRIKQYNSRAVPVPKKGTAEYRRGAFTRWHRFKVNQIFATALSDGDRATVDNVDVLEVKTNVSHLLDVVLARRRQRQADLYNTVGALSRIVARIDDELEDMEGFQPVDQLADTYSGGQFHVKYCEPANCDKSSINYERASKMPRMEETAVHDETLARLCDSKCDIPLQRMWAETLHTKLKAVDPKLPLAQLLHQIARLEFCAKCASVTTSCSGVASCANVISILLSLRVHFSYLRTLSRQVYRVREIALQLHLIELLLDSGTFSHFRAFKEWIQEKDVANDPDPPREIHELPSVSDAAVLEKYGTLLAACKQGWHDNMQIHECCSCLRLVGETSLRRVAREADKITAKTLMSDIVSYYERDRQVALEEVPFCFTCWRDLSGKNPTVPAYCYKNEIWPDKVPPQLKQLNPYELRLCSLATNCQNIVKLKPYNYRGPTSTLARGLKGISVHLPLPQGSIKAVEEILADGVTLPNMKSLAISLDGLPNLSKRLVFRSVVDMTSVMSALHWLKANNDLYKSSSIVISDAFMLSGINITVSQQAKKCEEIVEDIFQSVVACERSAEEFNPVVECNPGCDATHHPASDSSTNAGQGPKAKRRTSFFDCSTPASAEPQTPRSPTLERRTLTTISGSAIDEILAAKETPIPWNWPYPDAVLEHLVDDNTNVAHAPGHAMLENYTIIDVEKSMPKMRDLERFAMKPIVAKPLSWNDPLLDVACFPNLYPRGRNGIFHPRPRHVGVAMYLDSRINQSDPRFRRDQTWVLNSAIRKDLMAVDGSIHTVLNCGKFGKDVTAGHLKGDIASLRESKDLERCVNSLLGSVVGSPAYFMRIRRDVEAVIEDKGPATFFLTLSCGEYKNEDFREFLILRNTDVVNVERADVRHLISLDPVSVSLYFDTRFTVFWNTVIMNEEGPLGKVKYFYVRKEYQQRGAPHMHCLLWIEDAPRLEKDGGNADIVLEYIEQHVTGCLPDSVTSPVLHNLVQSCQVHRCTGSCTRKIMSKGKFIGHRCRYGFPRDLLDKGAVNSIQDVQTSRVGGRKRLRLYNLRRNLTEAYVNDYNPAILLQWKSNMDIQFTGEDSLLVNYYINKYMCKTEMQKPSDVSDAVDSCLNKFGLMKKVACKMLQGRQMGIFEAADKVNRLPMYRMNVTVKNCPFYMPNNDRRRLKTKRQLDQLPDESLDVYSRNFAHHYYPCRPDTMAPMTAHDVMSRYDYTTSPGPKQKLSPLYIEELNTCFVLRKNPAVVKIYKPTKNDPLAVETISFTMLALFKPWRNLDEILYDDVGNKFPNYTDSYNYWVQRLEDLQEFATSRQRLASAIEWSDEVQKKAAEELEKEAERQEDQQIDDACEAVALEMDVELCEQSGRIKSGLSQSQLDAEYQQLNSDQRKAFDCIKHAVDTSAAKHAVDTSAVRHAVDTSAAIMEEHRPVEAMRLFVSGVGGTGKSFLIRALRNYVEFHYSNDDGPAVLVAAPTGIAALNIDGVTIHKLLKLPVQKSAVSTHPFTNLGPKDGKLLKTVFRNAKLLILDEVSMLSNLMLLYVHQRLVEVKEYNDKFGMVPFANMNVLLLGDLLQLPPVNAQHVFTETTRKLIMKNMAVMGLNINLWNGFSFVELTENMRQRDDAFYAQMLDRIRLGNPTSADIEALKSRLICTPEEVEAEDLWIARGVEKMIELFNTEPEVLCLMPLTKHVDTFNRMALERLGLKGIKCVAEDAFEAVPGAKKGKNKRQQPAKRKGGKRKTADTGGLEEELTIAPGARVMLRRNMDPAKKLVNGSIGIIEGLEMDPLQPCVAALRVRFFGVPDVVSISRVSVKYCIGSGLFVMRSQFPVTLAYAITVHKCQGLSLESAIADIGPDMFADGMSYVVLSRVKRLRNLYLLRCEPGLIKCDVRSVKAYDILREAAGLSNTRTKCNMNREMVKWGGNKVVVSSDAQAAQVNELIEIHEMAANVAKRPGTAPVCRAPPAKKSRVDVSKETLLSGQYLKLCNPDGHACFANAPMQCLLRCVHFRDCVMNNASDTAFTQCLADVCLALANRDSESQSLDALREAFGNSSQFSTVSAMDCDPAEFIQSLLEKLPTAVSDLFNLGWTVTGHCPNRACKQVNVLETATDCFVAMATSIDSNNFGVKQLLPDKFLQNVTCLYCSMQNFRFPCKREVFFHSSNRYLILHVPILDFARQQGNNNQPIDKALLGFRDDGIRLFNIKWRLIAFVQVSGNWQAREGSRGVHYVAYVHHQNHGWILLNDEYQQLFAKRPPCRYGVLYILERTVN